MKLKIGKSQIVLPSGIVTSRDGVYHYWVCSVSGEMAFAPPEYWQKVLEKYGSEEGVVKNYVCRKAQKMLDSGKTRAEVQAVLADGGLKPLKKRKKEKKAKKEKKPSLKSFSVGKVVVKETKENGVVEIVKVEKVYPWQTNPDYFKSTPSVVSIGDMTKECCAFPNRYLDDECRNCTIYNECTFERKYTEEDWKSAKKRVELKVTPMRSFEVAP